MTIYLRHRGQSNGRLQLYLPGHIRCFTFQAHKFLIIVNSENTPKNILYVHWYSLFVSILNSLVPGTFVCNFRHILLKQFLVIGGWGNSCGIALIWMPLDYSDDQSTFVQVMAWCRQATSHYLSQCWPRYLWPYGVTRPQWVNSLLYTVRNKNFLSQWLLTDTVESISLVTTFKAMSWSQLFGLTLKSTAIYVGNGNKDLAPVGDLFWYAYAQVIT